VYSAQESRLRELLVLIVGLEVVHDSGCRIIRLQRLRSRPDDTSELIIHNVGFGKLGRLKESVRATDTDIPENASDGINAQLMLFYKLVPLKSLLPVLPHKLLREVADLPTLVSLTREALGGVRVTQFAVVYHVLHGCI
jgi:hypothetical protein